MIIPCTIFLQKYVIWIFLLHCPLKITIVSAIYLQLRSFNMEFRAFQHSYHSSVFHSLKYDTSWDNMQQHTTDYIFMTPQELLYKPYVTMLHLNDFILIP